jgi:hypothetical protein
MQNSRSKQAVGYSKESHLYSDVTAPSPAKISVNAFSPGRFSVQTRCLVRQTRSPQSHKPTEGNRSPHPLRMLLSSKAQQRYQSMPYSFDGSHSKFDSQNQTRTEGDRSPAFSECSHQQARQRYQSVPYSCDSSHPRFVPQSHIPQSQTRCR